jgi:hypothetical protein
MRPDPKSNTIHAGAPKGCNPQFRVASGLGSCSLVAAAAEGDAKKLPTMTMAAYNGGAMDVGWGLPVAIDLKGLDVAGHARPILKDHDPGQVVGHTTKITKVEGKSLAIEAIVSGTGAAAQEVVANAGNGFPWQASVGVAARNYEYVKEGSTGKANGQEFTGPLYIVRKGVLAETSVVAIGADSSTTTSIAARNRNGDTMKTFQAWLEAAGFDHDSLTDEQRTKLRAAYDAEVKASGAPAPQAAPEAPAPAADIQASRQAQAAETTRVTAIRSVCKNAHGEIEAKAILEGWSVEKTELEVLRAERAKAPQAPAGHVRGSADLATRGKAIVAALSMAGGVPEATLAKERGMTDQVMEAALSRDLRNIGLQALLHECIVAAGGHPSYGRVDDAYIQCAFDADRKLRASGLSAISLTNILGAVANKTALAAFERKEKVALRFASIFNATDFKTFTHARLVENGTFQKVGPGGELKHGSLSEDAYTNKVETYGQILSLTRQDMINDDLGVFLNLMQLLGENGAIAIEELAFTVLMANAGSHFSAGNKNYISGADTVLSIGGFTQGEQKMLDMVDSAGKPIMMTPRKLVVPTSLKVTAELLMKERMINETTTPDKGKPAQNPHAGKCEVLASPYINNAAITGNSSTAWFLFADSMTPALQIAFLRGQQTPTVQYSESDFDQLAVKFRGFMDVGAKLLDPRGAVMSKGAA